MASAEKTTIERIVKEEGIALELTAEEARAVWAVLWRVGGSPHASPRGLIDGVRLAITRAMTGGDNEFNHSWARPELTCAEGGFGLTFRDYSEVGRDE